MHPPKLLSSVLMVAAVLCAGSVAACSSSGVKSSGSKQSGSTAGAGSTPGSAGTTPAHNLDWQACTDEKATDPSLQCATLTVPLDYANPGVDTIDLALVRVPAARDSKGAVLFNPGGPGGSGFDYIAQGGPTITATLGLDDLDLIGFDPRGVDRSNGIRCLSDAEQDEYAYIDDTPDTPEEEAKSNEAEKAFAAACTAKYGDTLQFYSTDSTARDMDAIRAALGDDTISFLGISYGTYLGAVYATMFPDHVRALVLDSAFEPSGDTLDQQYETQLVGFEGAFDEWAQWCRTSEECAFKSDDVGAAWDALRAKLDASPVTNVDGRVGNQVVMVGATVAALYSKAEWPVLGAALADVANGDAAGIFRLADSYSGRDADGHYNTIDQSNRVITCASGLASPAPPDPAAYAAHLREIAPRFASTFDADSFDDQQQCAALMPAQPTDSPSYSGPAPIVIIGGTNDPATPIRWAQEMTADLGPSATMVTYTGEGHGQLLASKCITAIEAALLAELKSPEAGTTCAPDPEVERPTWWDSIPTPDGIDPVLDSPELIGALGITPTDAYSEMRTSDLSPADVLDAYKSPLGDAGFKFATEQTPLEGTDQALYTAPGGDLFSVFVIGADAFKTPDLESAADLVPAGKSIVLLLYIPQ